ncbi:flagellar assembly peptidoglycan hydrolase FlgJ [Thalassotalea euphylliae]|uniref:flagellar assembly peptidoglycan hydrolase FlgJ n=1 Tax=Thalassotalea euphylliae TaxID=1655234 RepID=UPI003638DFAB
MDSKLSEVQNFFDLNSLNNIREASHKTDADSKKAALKTAAQQFEAIFMQMLLKSMRKAEEVLESDSPFNSQSTKFYRDMHDQQLAVELSNNGTLGLAELIERQLGGGDGDFTPRSVLRTNDDVVRTTNMDSTSQNSVPSNIRRVDTSAAETTVKQTEAYSFEQPKDFVTALTEPAKQAQRKLGVPFEVVIAQAALETGWGKKVIQKNDGSSSNNLFNIKADKRWAGDKTNKDTLEFENGALIKKNEPFRVYDSLKDSVQDYISFLSSGSRYQDALSKPDNVEHFLQGLQKAGYATDPKYAEKILGTLKTVTGILSN